MIIPGQKHRQFSATLALLTAAAACKPVSNSSEVRTASTNDKFLRDFNIYPPFIDVQNFKDKLFVLGDVHGSFPQMLALLRASGVAGGTENAPEWYGGNSVLVSVGDLIDKGSQSISTLKYFMGLQKEAKKAGGQVHAVLGNHEVAFIIDPKNKKAAAFEEEALDAGVNVEKELHSASSPVGAWLRNLPMAVRVGQIYISHTGYLREDIATSAVKFIDLITTNGAKHKWACGDLDGANKFWGAFNASTWWEPTGTPEFLATTQRAQAKQIVFGHDPGAFGIRGAVSGFFGDTQNHALIKVDVGLVIGESKGEMLSCEGWNIGGTCSKFVTYKMSSSNAVVKAPLVIANTPPPSKKPDAIEEGC